MLINMCAKYLLRPACKCGALRNGDVLLFHRHRHHHHRRRRRVVVVVIIKHLLGAA